MNKIPFFWDLLNGKRARYCSALILGILKCGFEIFEAYLTSLIVDDVIGKGQYDRIGPIIGIFLASGTLHMLIWYYNRYTIEMAGQHVAFKMRKRGYAKLMALDFDYFDKNRTGDIMTRLTADIDYIRHFFAWVVYMIVDQAAIFIAAIVVMITMCDTSFIVLMALVLPVFVWICVKSVKELAPCFREVREMRANLNTIVQENISANRVVKAFDRAEFENRKMEAFNDSFRYSQYKVNAVARKYSPFIANIGSVFSIYNIVVGGMLVINGSMTIGEIVMFNGMVWMITAPLANFSNLFNEAANCMASGEKIMALLEEEPRIVNSENADRNRIDGNFEFKNVAFDYNGEGALKNISFNVKAGQHVGIVGATGSGKSTIINLISRFYDLTSGEILVDGVPIKEVDIERLRSSIAVAQQDVFLFSESVAANIAYGDALAPMEDIVNAAKIADAHGFISKLPEGYDTIIGERGVGLSGGQRQRLTLARAILKKPSVLVLDDTTSALDAATEKYIQNQLNCYFKDKTVFMISQRISSVKNCDMIIVLENGIITEMGRHDQLVRNGGYYSDVYHHQLGEKNESEVDE